MRRGFDLTRVSSKGQIVIPQHIREKLRLAEGDVFGVYEHQGLLVLKLVSHPLSGADAQAVEEIKRTHNLSHSAHRGNNPSYIH
jgi:AbrB family looped-hinge helix DNA binding protein